MRSDGDEDVNAMFIRNVNAGVKECMGIRRTDAFYQLRTGGKNFSIRRS